MSITKNIWMILLAVVLGIALCGCGGGGDNDELNQNTTPPFNQNPNGGDPNEPVLVGYAPGAFTIPGGYGDLRGVAVSQEYVYVADTTTLYCFDKVGNLVNQVAAPNTIQAVAVFPPKAELDVMDDVNYSLGGFPIIAHNPVPQYGYLTIYGPNLDTMTTREDQSHPDANKFISLPGGQVIPPLTQSAPVVSRVYDMTVDRFGSIMVIVDMTFMENNYDRVLQVLNVFTNFVIEAPTSVSFEGDNGETDSIDWPGFPQNGDYAIGDLGTLAFDTYFPFNRTEHRFTYYGGHYNLLRDFVGVSGMELFPAMVPPRYTILPPTNNGFGFGRVIGETVGNAPGSFNQNPPVNPNSGGLEDPDLTNGGPSGMCTDPLTDNVLICDPGNRRIQVFAPDTGAFVRQIGDGDRGNAGSSFIAPSDVAVDYEGNVYVCDVNTLRVMRENLPNRAFGNVAGTVKRLDMGTVLEGATVSLGNELGTLAIRTTNINGQYGMSNLLVGTYFMTATKRLYDSDTATIQILPDTTVGVNFNLKPTTPPTTGTYTGYIIDSFDNTFLAGVKVQLVGTSISTTTDSIGHFVMLNLPPGSYQVVFTHDDYATITRDIEILGGSTTTDSLLQMNPLV